MIEAVLRRDCVNFGNDDCIDLFVGGFVACILVKAFEISLILCSFSCSSEIFDSRLRLDCFDLFGGFLGLTDVKHEIGSPLSASGEIF